MTGPNSNRTTLEVGCHGQRLRALIVEDEILIAWQLKDTLEELGLEVDEFVSNGARALEVIRHREVEVVFLDVNLVGPMDGAETAQRIRQEADTPIVFVTAYADYDSIYKELQKIERSVVIGKPASIESIRGALQKLNVFASP